VLSARRGDDPYRARVAVEQLAAWVARDDWPQTLAAYSRCVRILRTVSPVERRTVPPDLVLDDPDPDRFVEADTRALHATYQQVAGQVTPEGSVDELFAAFLPLVGPITTFFDNVLVMAEDEALRLNRLALLQRIAGLTEGIVDLSKLQGF
jgi:glycyl-tRNA synthetase